MPDLLDQARPAEGERGVRVLVATIKGDPRATLNVTLGTGEPEAERFVAVSVNGRLFVPADKLANQLEPVRKLIAEIGPGYSFGRFMDDAEVALDLVTGAGQ